MAQKKSTKGSSQGTKKAGGAKKSASRKSTAAPAKARTGGATKAKAGSLSGVLKKIGVDESTVEVWRERMSGMGEQFDKIDVAAALDQAKKQAKKLGSASADALKKAGGDNPKLFYSGLAAIVVGAGLMTAARKGGKPRGSKKRQG